jgi:hypothetical protein
VAMIDNACKLLFLLVQNSEPPCLTFDALLITLWSHDTCGVALACHNGGG